MYQPIDPDNLPKRKRLINCFSFGLSEHGRLGIGPPDHARMIEEAGCRIGWHQPQEPVVDPKISNRRSRPTHVHGLARLAKIPHDVPEKAVGSCGGVVLPVPVKKPIRANGPKVVSVATRDSHTLALLENAKVYGWGNGSEGQLGPEVIREHIKEKEEEARLRKNMKRAEKVELTCATRVRDCNVWQPALQPSIPRVKRETDLGSFEDPVDPPASVYCSAKASFVLTKGGKVWSWGDGSYNVLGQTANKTSTQQASTQSTAADNGGDGDGSDEEESDDGSNSKNSDDSNDEDKSNAEEEGDGEGKKKKSKRPPPILAEVYMTENGCTQCSVPLLVGGPVSRQTVTMLACGSYHVLALTLSRKVLCWGRNDDGQLGIGRVSQWETPRQVKLNAATEPVFSIAAGEKHSLAVVQVMRADLRVERTVYAWGCRDNGRLGGVGDKRTFEPQEVTSLRRVYKKYHMTGYISQVFAGREHSVALTDSGRVITWGAGSYGQLGNGFGFDSELPTLIESIYNIVQVSCGARHTLALSCFHMRNLNLKTRLQDLPAPPKNAEEKALMLASKPTPPYDPFGKEDPCLEPPHFVMNEEGEPTDKMVVQRKNVVFGWGWNGFGELGTGDDLPRLAPFKIESLLPADSVFVVAGTHHSLVLTSGQASTVREDIQRTGGYGPYLRKMEEVYEKQLEDDEKRMNAFQKKGAKKNLKAEAESDGILGDDFDDSEDDDDGDKPPRTAKNKGKSSVSSGPAQLSEIGVLCLKLAALPIIKDMDCARLNSSLVWTPGALVPNQPGMTATDIQSSLAKQPKRSDSMDSSSVMSGADVSQQSKSLMQAPKKIPILARKWHTQEAVAPRDFSMGTYCLDTPIDSDKGRWPPVRGSYQAVYQCSICKLDRICLVCARMCHASHAVRVTLKSKDDVGGPCDCGVPVVVEEDVFKKKKKKRVQGGPAAERHASNAQSSLNRAQALGMKAYVNRCRCQGTLERKVFDKYIDELDGCIRLRQLEVMMADLHKTEQENEMEEEEKRTGKRPKSKQSEFDMQDAREAEEQLSVLINGPIEEDDLELDPLYDPLESDAPISYFMFHDWRKKHNELKKSRAAIEMKNKGMAEEREEEEND